MSAGVKQYFLKRDRLIILCCIVFSVAVLVVVGYFAERNAVVQANARMQGTLAFQTETLKTSMEKYTVLAALISRRPDILLALRARNPLDVLPSANQLTLDFIGISGASDIWIVDGQGDILRKDQPDQAISNISEETYFISAMQGNLGRGNIVTPLGKRFYIIASPIYHKNKILGVVVVRINLEYLEQVLVLLPDPILVIDDNQRVLLSSIKDWRLRYFNHTEISKNNKNSNKKERIKKLNEDYLIDSVSRYSKNKLTFKKELRKKEGRVFLQESQYVTLLDWSVHTFVNYDAVRSQRNNVILIAFLIWSLFAMSILMWRSHKRRLLKEQRSQHAFSLRLERQVRDRTHELSTSNQRLNTEIDERRNVEKHLREAQDELIQAAKLAGIGQMSTTLAHEYNQPLTAIRSYADNAATFIEQNNSATAVENLQRIKLLVDKMAGFTSTLRRFAHKSTHEYEVFSVDAVMDELIILLSPQAKKQNVSLQLFSPKDVVFIRGEQGRLLQIVTNLVTNAMDAVADSQRQQVEIQWYVENTEKKESNNRQVVIIIKDTGSGISDIIKPDMFNAFYTTKKSGNGLGLGLFIVSTLINDFKGTIALKDNEQGYGAIFELRLPLAELSNTKNSKTKN